jgi:CheY-like chemotaxis protein
VNGMTNILVVDDSAVDRRIVGGLLERHPGFRVGYAEDGTDALRKMEQARPDIVVTDLNMPRKNGLELVRAMRIHFAGVPVILITAQGSEELAVQALEQGAASYVPKVLLADKLIGTIEEVWAVVGAMRSHDRLVGSIDRTEYEFTFDNDPTLFDPFIEYFQPIVHGMGLCDDTDRFRVGMALKEALLNALLHGNLALDAGDASGLREGWMPGEEPAVIRARLAQPEFARRRMHVSVSIDADQAVFIVRDQGRGFDTAHLPTKGDLGALDAESGRGIVLMRAFMDDVTYNEAGNEVTLIKRRSTRSVGSTGAP